MFGKFENVHVRNCLFWENAIDKIPLGKNFWECTTEKVWESNN